MLFRLALCCCLLVFVLPTPQAHGEATDLAPDNNQSLEEVVVSARRKEELLTTVPASITTYTSDFMQKQNIQNFVDYVTRIPNLTFQYGKKGSK